jgi:hypothetical protein
LAASPYLGLFNDMLKIYWPMNVAGSIFWMVSVGASNISVNTNASFWYSTHIEAARMQIMPYNHSQPLDNFTKCLAVIYSRIIPVPCKLSLYPDAIYMPSRADLHSRLGVSELRAWMESVSCSCILPVCRRSECSPVSVGLGVSSGSWMHALNLDACAQFLMLLNYGTINGYNM